MRTLTVQEIGYWAEWTFRKVFSQQLDYLPRRLSYTLRKAWIDRTFPTHQNLKHSRLSFPKLSDPVFLRNYFQKRPMPRWHFGYSDINRIILKIPQYHKTNTIQAADNIVNHCFTFRGHPSVTLNPVLWDASPSGDRSWTWDLNRHMWFSTLGFAYWYTKDERYAQTFVELSSLWIEENSPKIGRLPWDTPFEAAARLNAWVWAYFLFLHCMRWGDQEHLHFLMALGKMAEYLYQTIEYHSPGNHILLEAKALAICAQMFPEFIGARRWSAKAWRILRREIKVQICADGVHAERSTMYHRIIAGELSELWLICLRNNLPQTKKLGKIVKQMAEFQACIDQGNGHMPLFGDAYADDTYYRFLAPFISTAIEKGLAPSNPLYEGDYNWWVIEFSEPNTSKETILNITPTLSSKAFPVGGYFVSRFDLEQNANVLVWDCGPTGYYANRKHAHLDALSITISVAGIPLLMDPGTDESEQLKQALRCTGAHNTIRIDGIEQGILAKRGEIWKPPEARLLIWAVSPECDIMSGSHDGYGRLSEPVQHIRTIVTMHKRYWLIVDQLNGRGFHEAEQRFHIAPHATVNWIRCQSCWAIAKGHANLSIYPFVYTNTGQRQHMLKSKLEVAMAEEYCGKPETTEVAVMKRAGQVPFSLGAVLTPAEPNIFVKVIDQDSSDSLHILEIEGNDFRDRICLNNDGSVMREVFEGWKTDAKITVLRYKADGEINDVLMAGGSTLLKATGASISLKNHKFQGEGFETPVHRFNVSHELS